MSLNSDAGHRVRLKASRWWHLDSAGTLGALDALYSGAVQLENRSEISRGPRVYAGSISMCVIVKRIADSKLGCADRVAF